MIGEKRNFALRGADGKEMSVFTGRSPDRPH